MCSVNDNNNCDLDTLRVGFFFFSFRLEASGNAFFILNRPPRDSVWGRNTGSHLHRRNIRDVTNYRKMSNIKCVCKVLGSINNLPLEYLDCICV